MNYYLILSLMVFAYMTMWFVISVLMKRNDVADIAWGMGFVLLSWTSYLLTKNGNGTSLLVNLLVTVWGLRLALHIFKRNKNKAEDYRYMEWRKQWGKYFYIRSYLQVYLLQGALLYAIALPIMIINKSVTPMTNVCTIVGILIWVTGFLFESIGDKQLAVFIRDPLNKGKLMTTGLWKYTRHPNYFGEVTLWWGIGLVSLATTGILASIIGPLTITFLILKVSGIPLLEQKMQSQDGFAEYARKTSVFIPWFPRE